MNLVVPKKPRLNIKHEKYITDKRKREAKFNRSLKKMNEMQPQSVDNFFSQSAVLGLDLLVVHNDSVEAMYVESIDQYEPWAQGPHAM